MKKIERNQKVVFLSNLYLKILYLLSLIKSNGFYYYEKQNVAIYIRPIASQMKSGSVLEENVDEKFVNF